MSIDAAVGSAYPLQPDCNGGEGSESTSTAGSTLAPSTRPVSTSAPTSSIKSSANSTSLFAGGSDDSEDCDAEQNSSMTATAVVTDNVNGGIDVGFNDCDEHIMPLSASTTLSKTPVSFHHWMRSSIAGSGFSNSFKDNSFHMSTSLRDPAKSDRLHPR